MRLALLLLAAPTLVWAQARNTSGGWWENPVTSGLDLTEHQERQINEVVREYRSRLVDSRAAVDKAENDLEDVFNGPYVDQRRGAEVIEQLVEARAGLTKAVSEMTLRLRAILTAEQWQELQRRERSRSTGRGRRGGPRNVNQTPVRPQVTVLR
jgi:Spy/CpxP family protein refolding chaperone